MLGFPAGAAGAWPAGAAAARSAAARLARVRHVAFEALHALDGADGLLQHANFVLQLAILRLEADVPAGWVAHSATEETATEQRMARKRTAQRAKATPRGRTETATATRVLCEGTCDGSKTVLGSGKQQSARAGRRAEHTQAADKRVPRAQRWNNESFRTVQILSPLPVVGP